MDILSLHLGYHNQEMPRSCSFCLLWLLVGRIWSSRGASKLEALDSKKSMPCSDANDAYLVRQDHDCAPHPLSWLCISIITRQVHILFRKGYVFLYPSIYVVLGGNKQGLRWMNNVIAFLLPISLNTGTASSEQYHSPFVADQHELRSQHHVHTLCTTPLHL